jgi:hypothetical protein
MTIKKNKKTKSPQRRSKTFSLIFNWDAALDKASKLMGVGVIIRDYEEKVLATMCSIMRYITNSAVAEAFAAWQRSRPTHCYLGR